MVRRILLVLAIVAAGFALYVGVAMAIRWNVERRFGSIRPGTSSSEVAERLGKPTLVEPVRRKETTVVVVNGCGDRDRECWFYISRFGGNHFVCFDAERTVTCEGRALVGR